jgi:hypothetical protein
MKPILSNNTNFRISTSNLGWGSNLYELYIDYLIITSQEIIDWPYSVRGNLKRQHI